MHTNGKQNINIWLSHIGEDSKVALSVDCVIFGYDYESLKILLLECNMPPFEGLPSLVGDLVKGNETLDEAARRVLLQRTGIHNLYLEQVATFSDVNRHPLGRVVSTAYYSLIKLENYTMRPQGNEKVFWQDIASLDRLAFDHNHILNLCIDRLKKRVREKPIGFNLLPPKFTLLQLQSLYEIILDIELDKRNFRRKLRSLEVLIEHNETQKDVSHRPARLYSFDKEAYNKKLEEGIHFEI